MADLIVGFIFGLGVGASIAIALLLPADPRETETPR
jgi:high-affinity nickel permease